MNRHYIIRRIHELFRFSLVGGLVTVVSLLLMFIFLERLNTPLVPTYVVLYASTILLSYWLNAGYTFRARKGIRSLVCFYGIYLFTLGLGSGLVIVLRNKLPYKNWIIAFMVVPITMLTNYFLSALIFKNRRNVRDE